VTDTPKPADERTPAEERAAQRAIAADAKNVGPNATTEGVAPKDTYFEVADPDAPGGFRKVNQWGETKGSDEDKKRMASL
jgi:hypothetical protein